MEIKHAHHKPPTFKETTRTINDSEQTSLSPKAGLSYKQFLHDLTHLVLLLRKHFAMPAPNNQSRNTSS